MGQAVVCPILYYDKRKKGFRIQQWVPHQKQKYHATAVATGASISAWMRRHWFHARHAIS
jgi:hypothetical protein